MSRANLNLLFASAHTQTYRWILTALIAWRVGDWIYTLSLNWSVFAQTQSPWKLALVNAARLMPVLLGTLPAGWLADNYRKEVILRWIQAGLFFATAFVGYLLWSHASWYLLLAGVFLRECIAVMEPPVRSTATTESLPHRLIRSGLSFNVSIMSFAKIVGPSLGGVLLWAFPSWIACLCSLPCYTLALLALLQFQLPVCKHIEKAKREQKTTQSLPIALRTLAQTPELRALSLSSLPIMLFGFCYISFIPAIVSKLFQLTSEGYGLFLAIASLGCLIASLVLTLRGRNIEESRSLAPAAALFGVSLLFISQVTSWIWGLALFFVIGFGGQYYRTCSRNRIQLLSPAALRGQILGLNLLDRALIPIGCLLVGYIMEHYSVRSGVATMGIGTLFGAFVLHWFHAPRKKAVPRQASSLGLLILLAPFFASCNLAPQAVRQAVPPQPQAIVALDFFLLEATALLHLPVAGYAGTVDQKLPKHLQSYYPEPPTFVGERRQPNLESIFLLKPDLILYNRARQRFIVPQLQQQAPVLTLSDRSYQDIFAGVAQLAEQTGRQAYYEQFEKQWSTELEQAQKKLQACYPQHAPSVMIMGAFDDDFSVWTQHSYPASLVQAIGMHYQFQGVASASESQTEIAAMSLATLSQLNPDYIFVYGHPEVHHDNPLYTQLKAYRDQHIIPVDRNLWARSRGPLAARLILAQLSSLFEVPTN